MEAESAMCGILFFMKQLLTRVSLSEVFFKLLQEHNNETGDNLVRYMGNIRFLNDCRADGGHFFSDWLAEDLTLRSTLGLNGSHIF